MKSSARTPVLLSGACFLWMACGSDAGGTEAVSIPFAAMVGDQPFACSEAGSPKSYQGLGTSGSTVTFKDFRLYVSNLRLVDASGTEVPVALEPSDWQLEDVALLDFEDGTGECVDVGNSGIHTSLVGRVPSGTYDGIKFDVAVPFDKNHLDASALETPSPLNIMSLFWNWQVGHKYARIDLAVEGADPWNLHLGSTGCVSDGPMDAPTTECSKPNVAQVSLTSFDPATDTVVIDAAALFADSDLAVNDDGPPGCQSFPMDATECTPLYPNLGMDFGTGLCEGGCEGQTVFSRL